MKHTVSDLLVAITVGAAMLFGSACSRGTKVANSGGPAVQSKPDAKLLLRERHTGVLAADGLLFFIECTAAEVKDEVRQTTGLNSGGGLNLQAETRSEFKNPVNKKPLSTPHPWEKDPKDFDFLLDWNIDLNEHTKLSMGEPLIITVNESLKLTKVSDPKITKTWSYTYDLEEAQNLGEPNKDPNEVALDQLKTRVSPARGPVLKEIRSFIQSNK